MTDLIKKITVKKIKEKLKKSIPSIGTWVQIPNEISAEILSKAQNIDWVCIDLEHSSISYEKCESLIRAIDSGGSIPFVRLTSINPDQIKRVLDSGARGIIVPMVNTLEDVKKAFNAMHYPPEGTRGVGLARAQEWGNKFEKYIKNEKDNLLVVQIENIEAIKNLDMIFSSNLVDSYIVGPYDLSASMGIHGDFTNPMFKKALKEISIKAKQYNVPKGFHLVNPEIKELKKLLKDNYTFIAYSIDTVILTEKIKFDVK
jgi:2-dehydro-3-deoxyglucarate aldolase